MSLTPTARAVIERFSPTICKMSNATITTSIEAEQLSALWDDALQIDHEDDYRAFYAPFDWINDEADIVLVGVTPGKQQAVEALQSLRKALLAGKNFDEAAPLGSFSSQPCLRAT